MQIKSIINYFNNFCELLCDFVAESGDYDPDEHGEGAGYLSEFKFCPKQVIKKSGLVIHFFQPLTRQVSPLNKQITSLYTSVSSQQANHVSLYMCLLSTSKSRLFIQVSPLNKQITSLYKCLLSTSKLRLSIQVSPLNKQIMSLYTSVSSQQANHVSLYKCLVS